MSGIRAFLAFCLRTVRQVFLQSAFHTVLPSVDRFVIQFHTLNQFDHLVDRHTVAQDTGDQLGIVPEFRIELAVQTFDRHLVTPLILELEVVMLLAVLVIALDNATLRNVLRQHDTFIVIGKTGKDFVRATIQQTDKCNPLLTVVLEFHHVGFQFARTGSHDNRRLHTVAIFFFLLLVIRRQQYT